MKKIFLPIGKTLIVLPMCVGMTSCENSNEINELKTEVKSLKNQQSTINEEIKSLKNAMPSNPSHSNLNSKPTASSVKKDNNHASSTSSDNNMDVQSSPYTPEATH